MSVELQAEFVPLTGWRRVARDSENLVLTVALLTMMMLPVIQIICRKTGLAGISGATVILRHL